MRRTPARPPTGPAGPFIERHALCETKHVGDGTRVWAFAHILPGARIGALCNICDHVFIENDVVIGDRVTVKCGVQLWDGVTLEDDVFVGPNVTFTNDRMPRSRLHLERVQRTVVERGASLGANCTILPGLRIGAQAMVGAGSVVTRDVPRGVIVRGNPACVTGYVDTYARPARRVRTRATVLAEKSRSPTSVPGVVMHGLKTVRDPRGTLCVGEFSKAVPFRPARWYLVYDVPGEDVRGESAHRLCAQFFVCAHGSVGIVVDDARAREEILLDRPQLGLYVPPMVWSIHYRYSPDAVLLVFASRPYDVKDYIRDYDAFRGLASARAGRRR